MMTVSTTLSTTLISPPRPLNPLQMDEQIAQSKVLADMSEMMRTMVAGKANPAEDPEVLAAVARQAGCTDKGELSFELEQCNVAVEKIRELVEDVLERIDLLTGTCRLRRLSSLLCFVFWLHLLLVLTTSR